MKQFFVFFHPTYSDIFYAIPVKKKKSYVAANHWIDFTSYSWFYQPAVWRKKKRVEAGLLLCFGEIYPLWFVAKGLAGRTWDSQLPFGQVGQKVTNYTFPLNTPKLSEFQRKCLLTSFSRFCSAGNGKFMRPRIDLRRASLVV